MACRDANLMACPIIIPSLFELLKSLHRYISIYANICQVKVQGSKEKNNKSALNTISWRYGGHQLWTELNSLDHCLQSGSTSVHCSPPPCGMHARPAVCVCGRSAVRRRSQQRVEQPRSSRRRRRATGRKYLPLGKLIQCNPCILSRGFLMCFLGNFARWWAVTAATLLPR